MKRILIVALVLVASATFNKTAAQNLQSRVDTLSYAIGMAQSQGLAAYLKQQYDIDSQYMDDFVKGLLEGIANNGDKGQVARYAGEQIGLQIIQKMMPGMNKDIFGEGAEQSIALDHFLAGFVSGATGKGGLMTPDSAQQVAQSLMTSVKAETMEKKYGANRVAGEQFLADNAKKADVKTLPCGVQYKVIKQGTGAKPTMDQKVKVHYEGRLIDGTVFDSSYKRGEPAEFGCKQVIRGWTEALMEMPVGSTWEVYIPQELAYGEREMGSDIKPFSALIFKIELLDIVADNKDKTKPVTKPAVKTTKGKGKKK